jgi:hypothetical protein
MKIVGGFSEKVQRSNCGEYPGEQLMAISCDNTGEIDVDEVARCVKALARASRYGKT